MYESRFFRITSALLMILLILFLLGHVNHIFIPIRNVLSILLTPLLAGVFLYYLLRPLVYFLTLKLRSKSMSILISFIVIIILVIIVSYFGGSIVSSQIRDLIGNLSNYYQEAGANINSFFSEQIDIFPFLRNVNIQEKLTTFIENIINSIRYNLFGFFSTLTNVSTIIVLIPFVLFYFLKDDRVIYQNIINLLPDNHREQGRKLLKNIDYTLSRYIGGQLIIALFLGILTYIGYLIIRLPNALILAIIATVTSFIPFIGPILGILPAILIAVTTDLFLVIKVLIVLIVVQQLEGNLIQPRIQGKRLEIHPLMVIFVVLSSVILFGFVGAIFAAPIYAVLRVVVGDFYKNRVLEK